MLTDNQKIKSGFSILRASIYVLAGCYFLAGVFFVYSLSIYSLLPAVAGSIFLIGINEGIRRGKKIAIKISVIILILNLFSIFLPVSAVGLWGANKTRETWRELG